MARLHSCRTCWSAPAAGCRPTAPSAAGTGLVYAERIQSPDFWLLDLATGTRRQLARLGNHGGQRTFDITPDGKSIVFDRLRQNSNIVLIDVPK